MPTLKHKYCIGATVYYIYRRPREVREPCPSCSNVSGFDRTKFSCKGCHNRGYIPNWIPDQWMVDGPYTIGQVTIVMSRPRNHYKNFDKVQYMMYETGVVSGTIYDETSLFRTKGQAEKECRRRQKLEDAAKVKETV